VQKANLQALPSTAAGAFFGLALGLLLQMLNARFGAYGGLIFLVPVLLIIFMLLRGHLRVIINDSTMLMLTVATIAHVQTDAKFSGLFTSLAIAVVFFGGLFWIIDRIKARSRVRPL
jgi:cation transporter-like permease